MNIFFPKVKGNRFVLILIFIILAVTTIIAGHLYYQNYKKNFRREVESRLTAIAELKAFNLSLWRQERLGDANIYYNNASFIDLAQNYFERPEDRHCQETLKAWFGRINTNDYDGVFLLDATGTVRLTATRTEDKLCDIVKQKTLDTLQSGKITFLDFHRHEDSKRIFLDLVIPLINRTDGERVIGALVWRIDPHAYLYPFIQQWPTPSRTAETLIVRKEGNDVLFLNELKFQKDTALNLRFPLETSKIPAAMAVKGSKGIIEGKDYRGVPVIADGRPVPDSPWFMVNRMDIAEVFAPLKETYWIVFALISSLLLVLLFGVLFWQKHLAENALREREEDLSITLYSIGDAMIATDMEGRITRMNPVAERLTGWPLAEAAGRPLADVFHIINSKTREPAANPVKMVMTKGLIVGLANHTALIARDGTEYQIADSAAPILDVQGHIRGIVLVFHDVTGEYKAKEALRQKTEELDRYFTSSLDLLCIADTDGYFHRLNPEWEKTLGYSVQELQGKLFLDFVHPEDMAATIAAISRLKDQKEVLNFENRYRCKNGSYRWIEWRSYPSGKMIYAVARDITERKRSEEELRGIAWLLTKAPAKKWKESEYCPEYGDLIELNTNPVILRYVGKNLLEEIVFDFMRILGTSSAIYEKDGSYALGIFSSGWCRFLDLASRRLCDTPDNKKALCSGRWLCHESCWTECAKKAVETAQSVDIECNGGIHLYAVPILAGNEIVGAINFGYGNPPQDKQKLQELAKCYDVGIEELRQYSREYENRPQFIIEVAKERLLTSAKLIGEIIERKRAEEALSVTNKQLQDAFKTASKLTVQAQAASAAKGQFIANISHEIRTPLNGIIGICELLLGTGMSAEQKEYAQIINSSAETLRNIINATLDFSKIDAGKMELEHIDFNLRTIFEDIISVLAVNASKKNLELIGFIEPATPLNLNGDPGRLRQILFNLIGNAIKFTSQGEIAATVAPVEEKEGKAYLRFSVRDTGIGIPSDKVDDLFLAFTQADESFTRKFGGTGLGLAIAKGLVEQMGGKIGVENNRSGGSTFWFVVPFSKQQTITTGSFEPDVFFGGQRILVVDDNETNRTILAMQLQAWGVVVDTAESGEQALEKLRLADGQDQEPFLAAIVDLRMPEMDGLMLAKNIKAKPEYQDLSLILMSSMILPPEIYEEHKNLFAGIILKPIRQSHLYYNLITALSGEKSENKTETKEEPAPEELVSPIGLRVLVVEDNVTNQKVIGGILGKMGHTTIAVANGKEALQALEMAPYNLVLMDVQMPEMDGFEATALIRNPGTRVLDHNIPILALTAHALEGDREKCLAAGMNGYIPKPVTIKTLAVAIADMIASHGIKTFTLLRQEALWLATGRNGVLGFAGFRKDAPRLAAGCFTKEKDPQKEPALVIFDEKSFAERLMNDKELMRETIRIFLEDTPKKIRELEKTTKDRNQDAAVRVAHTIKGSAANVSGQKLHTAAEKIEAVCKAADWREVEAFIPRLNRQFEMLEKAMREYLKILK